MSVLTQLSASDKRGEMVCVKLGSLEVHSESSRARNKAGPVLLMDFFCLFLIFIFLGCSFQPGKGQFTVGHIGKELRVGIQMNWCHVSF